jgi:glucose-1-phosphate thymidylyltransferase
VELAVPIRCIRVEIAKALILATKTPHERPWPSVRSGPKHLVPIANRPILFHHLEALRRAGLLEATIAVDEENADAIPAVVGDGSPWGLTVRYVDWQADTGMGGALASAHAFLADEPVLVQPADALHRDLIHPHIAAFARDRLDAMALTIAAANPFEPGVGGYLFSHRAVAILLDGVSATTDPVADVRRHGGQVRLQQTDAFLPCHGGQNCLLEGNRRMLEPLDATANPADFPGCEFQGPVLIDPTATLDHTLVRGPAVIGARTRLSHAYVGPYTSIGDDVRIEGSQIEHSIVLDGAELMHIGARVDSSVVGRGARVHKTFTPTQSLRLSVGEGAEVLLP